MPRSLPPPRPPLLFADARIPRRRALGVLAAVALGGCKPDDAREVAGRRDGGVAARLAKPMPLVAPTLKQPAGAPSRKVVIEAASPAEQQEIVGAFCFVHGDGWTGGPGEPTPHVDAIGRVVSLARRGVAEELDPDREAADKILVREFVRQSAPVVGLTDAEVDALAIESFPRARRYIVTGSFPRAGLEVFRRVERDYRFEIGLAGSRVVAYENPVAPLPAFAIESRALIECDDPRLRRPLIGQTEEFFDIGGREHQRKFLDADVGSPTRELLVDASPSRAVVSLVYVVPVYGGMWLGIFDSETAALLEIRKNFAT